MAPVDPDRIYFMGHSNGGFMSYRMACEASERVAAIVSLAGSDFLGDDDCVPTAPVSVLQVHGTLDGTIRYEGGDLGAGAHPSAEDVVARWAARAGCDTSAPTAGDPLDLDASVEGAETRVTRYDEGCPRIGAERWRIEGGVHIPPLTRHFTPRAVEWLLDHPR